jgi:Winged helix-turn helix
MKYMDAAVTAGVKIGNVARWCRENGVDRRTFCRHRERIEAEGSWQPRSRRPRTSPGATSAGVAAEIVRLRGGLAPDNGADAVIAALGLVAAAQDWAGRGWRVPHRSTVNKILKRAGLVKPKPRKRPRSSFRRFAYARPRDCYQLDATEVKLADGTPATVFEVLDDCTRLLAACQYRLLREAAGRAVPGSDGWCVVQFFAGYAAWFSGDMAASLGHATALRNAAAKRGPCPALADGLAGRAAALALMGRHAEAADDARQALAVAREIAYPLGQVQALGGLAAAAQYGGDLDGAVRLARQAGQVTAGVPGSIARW